MKLLALDIPVESAELPTWLEGHLMGADLPQLVTELSVLSGEKHESAMSLQELLGDQSAEVLLMGLESLSRDKLRRLLNEPRLLLDLQRSILDQGGSYWLTVPQCADATSSSRVTWARLTDIIRAEAPKSEPAQPTLSNRHPWYWAGAGWLAAAAALGFALYIQTDRVQQLEQRLIDQANATDALRKEFREWRELPENRIVVVDSEVHPSDIP